MVDVRDARIVGCSGEGVGSPNQVGLDIVEALPERVEAISLNPSVGTSAYLQ